MKIFIPGSRQLKIFIPSSSSTCVQCSGWDTAGMGTAVRWIDAEFGGNYTEKNIVETVK